MYTGVCIASGQDSKVGDVGNAVTYICQDKPGAVFFWLRCMLRQGYGVLPVHPEHYAAPSTTDLSMGDTGERHRCDPCTAHHHHVCTAKDGRDKSGARRLSMVSSGSNLM